ncbi:MAG: immunoglobulin domain-containing protein [Opitutales bacterium]|nr:immunoglobulin domain-containing protein [Opitutales bacterium]
MKYPSPVHFRVARRLFAGASLFAWATASMAAVPTDNPVAAHYGPGGYALWTHDIQWDNVIDMSTYTNGANDFERFENARDELHALGGGVLYYPAGVYEFEMPDMGYGPGIGPKSRGLMLKSGVVIRGADLAPGANQAIIRESEDSTTPGFNTVTYNLAPQTVFRFQTQIRGTDPVTLNPNSAGEVPRDWNFIGMVPGEGEDHIGQVQNIGVVNVKLDGGFIFWGFHMPRAATLDTGRWMQGWKTNWPQVFGDPPEEDSWAKRFPDGTHYMDAINGAEDWHTTIEAGSGRLIFGVYSINGAPWDDMSNMDFRPSATTEWPVDGFHSYRYTGRFTAHGTDIFIGNNVLARPTKNFVHSMLQRWDNAGGVRQNAVVLFDYSNHIGVDVNKSNFGARQNNETVVGPNTGYHFPNVIVRDNWIFNRGNKGMDIAGQYLVLYNNHNERLPIGGHTTPRVVVPFNYITNPQYYINNGLVLETALGTGLNLQGTSFDGWRWQTQTTASDYMSRGYDIGGRNVWAHRNSALNPGSIGNDGEGVMAQRHNNIETFSWAFTNNRVEVRATEPGTPGKAGTWSGIYDMHAVGFLSWNDYSPESGFLLAALNSNWILDTTIGPNLNPVGATRAPVFRNDGVTPAVQYADYQPMHTDPVSPPTNLSATELPDGRGIVIQWEDTADNELGFRVERRFADTDWHVIAYRPAQSMGAIANKTSPYTANLSGAELNPQRWTDFMANAAMGPDYRVVAFNANDDDSTGVSVTVGFGAEGPPLIFTSPQSAAVPLGGTHTLTVSATANPPPTFQWYFNGAEIPGATEASLTLTDFDVSMIGDYSVIVSNGLEPDAESDVATLTQLFAPTAPSGLAASVDQVAITLTWVDNSGNEDGFIIEQWTGSAWVEARVVGAGVTSATFSGLDPLTTYQFRVSAFNAAGPSAATAPVMVTTGQGPQLFLINFADDESYAMDPAGNRWQTIRLRQTEGADTPFRPISNALLQTVTGDTSRNIRLGVSSTITTVGYQNSEAVQASWFVNNPFDWFTPTEPQREVFAFNQNGANFTYTFSGFAPDDEVTFEMIIRRGATGRRITLTYNPGEADQEILLNNEDSGVTQYVSYTISGADTYTFRLHSTVNNWVASINAMAVRVATDDVPPVVPVAPVADVVFSPAAGGMGVLSLPTVSGLTYQLQISTDLGDWEDVPGAVLSGDGSTQSFTNLLMPDTESPELFYRVKVLN